jgi:hypothetical protein
VTIAPRRVLVKDALENKTLRILRVARVQFEDCALTDGARKVLPRARRGLSKT